jgi:hypothetical protein
MKKILLVMMIMLSGALLFSQSDTLTGWTFPVATGPDSLNANLGTAQNQGYDIRFQWDLTAGDTTVNTVYFAEGASTFAAATAGWDDGEDTKYWSIKFKAPDYANFKVSSKQRSSADPPGPHNFTLQWRLSATDFEDIPGGTIMVADDWLTGVVDNLPVPIADQGTNSIYIRWLMAAPTEGDQVSSLAVSMIDDIVVTGTSALGVNEILFTNRLHLFPNPNNGNFSIRSSVPVENLFIADLAGKIIYRDTNHSMEIKIDRDLTPGIYFLNVRFTGSEEIYSTRFVVR